MDASDVAKIREIEANVFDKEFKRFKILQVSSTTSIPYFLKAYGDAARDSLLMTDYPEFTHRRILHQLILAISQCIKWVVNESKDNNIDGRIIIVDEIPNEVNNLIKWAFEYIGFAQQFTAWSRGYVKVSVNEKEKEIRFEPTGDSEMYAYYLQQEIADGYIDRVFEDILSSKLLHQTFNLWAKEYEIAEPPIAAYMDWSRAVNSSLFAEVHSKISKYVLPELDMNTDLGGYTLGQFRVFYTALFLNFQFICSLEQHFDRTNRAKALAFGSNPIVFSKDMMIKFLRQTTAIPGPEVSAILDDLTLDLSNFHSNLITQPIVRCASNQYSILPNLFGFIEPNRMLSGALNKSDSKRKIYSRLIDQIERKNVLTIQAFLRQTNHFKVCTQEFKDGRGKSITPDFVLIDSINNCILIIDYKHFLNPLNASETAYRISEIKKGVLQVRGYEEFFIENEEMLLSFGVKEGFSAYKLLLTRFPTPVPLPEEDVRIIDLEIFKTIFQECKSLNDVDLSIRKYGKNDTSSANKFEQIHFSVNVGGWRFVRTAHAGMFNDA